MPGPKPSVEEGALEDSSTNMAVGQSEHSVVHHAALRLILWWRALLLWVWATLQLASPRYLRYIHRAACIDHSSKQGSHAADVASRQHRDVASDADKGCNPGVRAAKEGFLSIYGHSYGYGPHGMEEVLTGFARLAAKDVTYLDHAGATLYSSHVLQEIFAEYEHGLFGNPHSSGQDGDASLEAQDLLRKLTLDMCGASAKDYEVIFTSGATAGLKLVGECFPWTADSHFVHTLQNHNSVLGIRGYALKGGAHVSCVDWCDTSKDGLVDLQVIGSSTGRQQGCHQAGAPGEPCHLFAFPLECNFSGLRLDEGLTDLVQSRRTKGPFRAPVMCTPGRWFVLLDAAKACSTQPPQLGSHPADFVVLSYYKICGYPTGLGALLVRKHALACLKKDYFGGGTVQVAVADEDFAVRRPGPAGWEDGTQSFLAIVGACKGLQYLQRLGGFPAVHRHTACLTAYLADQLLALRHGTGGAVCVLYGWDRGNGARQLHRSMLALNFMRADDSWVGYREVERLARLNGLHIRTGCFCNPGACSKFLKLSGQQMRSNFEAGHVCWDDHDMMNGQPTGAVRVSLGLCTSFEDVYKFVVFVKTYFVESDAREDLGVQLEGQNATDPTGTGSDDQRRCSNGGPSNHVGGSACRVAALYLYPLKSCAAQSVTCWPLGPNGLLFDREWALVTEDGKVLTQKKCQKLTQIQPFVDLVNGTLTLHAAHMVDKLVLAIPGWYKGPALQPSGCSMEGVKVCGDLVCGVLMQTLRRVPSKSTQMWHAQTASMPPPSSTKPRANISTLDLTSPTATSSSTTTQIDNSTSNKRLLEAAPTSAHDKHRMEPTQTSTHDTQLLEATQTSTHDRQLLEATPTSTHDQKLLEATPTSTHDQQLLEATPSSTHDKHQIEPTQTSPTLQTDISKLGGTTLHQNGIHAAGHTFKCAGSQQGCPDQQSLGHLHAGVHAHSSSKEGANMHCEDSVSMSSNTGFTSKPGSSTQGIDAALTSLSAPSSSALSLQQQHPDAMEWFHEAVGYRCVVVQHIQGQRHVRLSTMRKEVTPSQQPRQHSSKAGEYVHSPQSQPNTAAERSYSAEPHPSNTVAEHSNSVESYPSNTAEHVNSAQSHPSDTTEHVSLVEVHPSDTAEHVNAIESHPSNTAEHVSLVESYPSNTTEHVSFVGSHRSNTAEHVNSVESHPSNTAEHVNFVESHPSKTAEHVNSVESHPSQTAERFSPAESHPNDGLPPGPFSTTLAVGAGVVGCNGSLPAKVSRAECRVQLTGDSATGGSGGCLSSLPVKMAGKEYYVMLAEGSVGRGGGASPSQVYLPEAQYGAIEVRGSILSDPQPALLASAASVGRPDNVPTTHERSIPSHAKTAEPSHAKTAEPSHAKAAEPSHAKTPEPSHAKTAESTAPSSLPPTIGFSNEGQFLLVNEASVKDLASRVAAGGRDLDARRFRPNIVVAGIGAYAEDGWPSVRIGGCDMMVDGPCARCDMVRIDQEAGVKLPADIMLQLAGYRRKKGKLTFGILLSQASPCKVRAPPHAPLCDRDGASRDTADSLTEDSLDAWIVANFEKVLRVGSPVAV